MVAAAGLSAFVFWGFLVLRPTILLGLISQVGGRPDLPWAGRQGWWCATTVIRLAHGRGRSCRRLLR